MKQLCARFIYVYCLQAHPPSGKVYVGITRREPKVRWNNGFGYRTNEHFWRSIVKYGWDNFEHEIIATDLTEEEAYSLEIQLIAEYDSTNPEKGYNHSTGGECIRRGVKVSVEQKQKISEMLRGRTLSEETKQKLSDANKGKHGDRVQCIETGKIYRNAQEAQNETGIYFRGIQRAASGYQNNAGGLHWRFVDVNKQYVFDPITLKFHLVEV